MTFHKNLLNILTRQEKNILNNYFEKNKISKEIKEKATGNLKQINHINKLYNNEIQFEIMEKLPKDVKRELLLESNIEIIKNSHFLSKNFNISTLEDISKNSNELSFQKDELLFEVNKFDPIKIIDFLLEK